MEEGKKPWYLLCFFLSHFIANSSVFEIDLFRQQFKENLLSSLSHFKLMNACKYECGFVELLSLFYTQAVSKQADDKKFFSPVMSRTADAS